MSQPSSTALPSRNLPDVVRRPLTLPAWLMSLVFHAALFVILALLLQMAPRGTGFEPTRTVGVVLKHHRDNSDGGDYYEGQTDAEQASADSATASAASLLEETVASDPTDALPSAEAVLGFGGQEGGGQSGVSGFLDGPRQGRSPSKGRARTSVFGVESEGYKFIYVFDRSGSMGGTGRSALDRAKSELLASLENLGPTHQFQLIFYNEKPTMFALAGQPGRLVFGNEANKTRAANFIRGIVADGATHHESALISALNLKPDVIFFLTDADQPVMSAAQLHRIRQRNRAQAVINTIEFGLGPSLGDENFLARLAKENGGAYTYVDITKK